LAHAEGPLVRAQMLAWAQLPALAALGRPSEADQVVGRARTEFGRDPRAGSPGRFGFDMAELELHAAEAYLVLSRADAAARHARASAGFCSAGTPGWAAATLVRSSWATLSSD